MSDLRAALALGALAGIGLAAEAARAERPVVAVFALENKGTRFKQEELDRLLDYVGASLTSSGRYTVVPQDELKRALQTQKAASYKACYAESCQIEIGKELAATKTLAGTVSRFGRTCLVTLKLFDLAQAVQDAAGTGKGGCSEEAVMASLDAALAQVSGVSEAPKAQADLQAAVQAPAVKASAAQPPAVQAPPTTLAPPPAEMVAVPAGPFIKGCVPKPGAPECYGGERPERTVILEAFSIDKTEVTVAAFKRCVDAGACEASTFRSGESCNWGRPERDQHPMNCVNWSGADAFCRWAGRRLPTETEFEKAARGTDGRRYPWGNAPSSCAYAVLDDGGNACGRGETTWQVGSKPAGASPYGALDMAGNVWEWTSDWYVTGKSRVVRGGSYGSDPTGVRASGRTLFSPRDRLPHVGFRCAGP
ncbi:MAG: SUMF1/EgtB/PvdO family nonheme iron enzyme [Deltaproteobacteria bacterium]|nr:SUMF1/EgtB/PvdO family nonheme iron enzyme [Deltaproteobacteria bacterium]